MIEDITPLIITYNEAPNIARTLDKLSWARRIVVIDSGSTDATIEIVHRFPQAEVLYRAFDNFANQCKFGLTQIRTPWVLSLDADYELSDSLVAELSTLEGDAAISGYRVRFVYCVYGRPLRGSLYPPRTVLYRTDRGHYRNEGHGHRIQVSGTVRPLAGVIFHDDRKSFSRWLASQQRYAKQEADYLLGSSPGELRAADRMRLVVWAAPIAVPIYTLVIKRCALDGWPGWFYMLQRVLAEILIALEILDRRLRSRLGAQTTFE